MLGNSLSCAWADFPVRLPNQSVNTAKEESFCRRVPLSSPSCATYSLLPWGEYLHNKWMASGSPLSSLSPWLSTIKIQVIEGGLSHLINRSRLCDAQSENRATSQLIFRPRFNQSPLRRRKGAETSNYTRRDFINDVHFIYDSLLPFLQNL